MALKQNSIKNMSVEALNILIYLINFNLCAQEFPSCHKKALFPKINETVIRRYVLKFFTTCSYPFQKPIRILNYVYGELNNGNESWNKWKSKNSQKTLATNAGLKEVIFLN